VAIPACFPTRRRMPRSPVGAVAEASGFFDQAHLANEIRLMAGLTPTELRGHGAGGVFED